MQAAHHVHTGVQRSLQFGQPMKRQHPSHRRHADHQRPGALVGGLRRVQARQVQRDRGRGQRPLAHDVATAPVAQAECRLGIGLEVDVAKE